MDEWDGFPGTGVPSIAPIGWVGVPRGIGTSRRWCLVLHASRYTLYSLIPILYLPSYQYPTLPSGDTYTILREL